MILHVSSQFLVLVLNCSVQFVFHGYAVDAERKRRNSVETNSTWRVCATGHHAR